MTMSRWDPVVATGTVSAIGLLVTATTSAVLLSTGGETTDREALAMLAVGAVSVGAIVGAIWWSNRTLKRQLNGRRTGA